MDNGLQKALEQQWTSPVFDPTAYFKPVETWMQVHRVWESIAAKQFKAATHDSFDNALKNIEAADKAFHEKVQQTKEQGLVFPFDMMQLASDNMVAGWNAVTGLTAESSVEQIELLEDALAQKTVECEKALKAKQTAQRNQRKAKTDLDAANEKLKALNEDLKASKTELDSEKKSVKKLQSEWLTEQQKLIKENDLLKQQVAELQQKQAALAKVSDAS
ncbi:hypothetical protein KDD30_19200 (plasmid) [Photobacterium sp. GJ3]|uniref:hypothetical protein n=1 Tax=Photobacterium sp. GJ3 TaxID=2829502 RepID=UPI001B8D2EF3|nr:hypothetical protein [Photobacterium sp. GJ3]QUJ70252.1 hypothetical protein KDD30_19200 [Photobacterium sp. GJ3]